MARSFNRAAAEQEANEIAFQFQDSNDVIGDMSRAYHTDFSGIRIHTDEAAAERVQAAGTDALAAGRDIFFGRGILESQEPASKGLLAHELVHTMQQGMAGGEAAEAVSEQAPAGTEQGGILDFFRSMFKKKPKTEHLGSTKATDEASLAYMAAMKAREQEIFDEKRASALGGIPINENRASPELLANARILDAKAIPNADKQWLDNGTEKNPKSRGAKISTALQALGHRMSSEDTGQNDKKLRAQVFAGTSNSYESYLRNLETSGIDFGAINQNKEQFNLAGKSYFINDSLGGITGDLYSILEQYLLSDSGLEYAENFVNGVQDAKVFQEGGANPLSYLLATLVTGEGASLTRAMLNNGYKQLQTGNVKDMVGQDIRKDLMVPVTMDMISEEERKALPPQVQSLYAKYQEVQRQLAEALEARRANR